VADSGCHLACAGARTSCQTGKLASPSSPAVAADRADS